MMDEKIQITQRQNEYLLALEDGPKVTRDFVLLFGVTNQSAGKMIHRLRSLGLVVSSEGHIPQHQLVRSYPELVADGLVIGDRRLRCSIPYEEFEYVAQLRDEGLVGQRLIDRYLKQFPDCFAGGVKYRVNRARMMGLF